MCGVLDRQLSTIASFLEQSPLYAKNTYPEATGEANSFSSLWTAELAQVHGAVLRKLGITTRFIPEDLRQQYHLKELRSLELMYPEQLQ